MTRESVVIFESFALPSLEDTIGTISPFLFAIDHRKSCSKRHLKNIILLNIDSCACVRACLCFNNNMFLVTRQVHSYGTRSSELFCLPQCRINIRKFSISFQGPNFFNSLSFEIRNATSTVSFCCKLKAFLLS